MKVSVLIPIYNAEEFIENTIQSVLDQSYQNIEIIMVDDGSTDDSLKIASQFESEKIKVFKQNNKGASGARNKAFALSSGDLIQYLDADDLLHPRKIEVQVKEYEKYNNEDLLLSGRWGRFEGSKDTVKWESQKIDKDYDDPKCWLIDSWNGSGMAQPGVWLTHRNLIKKAGPWDENLSLNDDGEFYCRVLLNANKIKFVPESEVYYRSNINSSLSNTRTVKALRSELDSYSLCADHILKKEDSVEVRKAIGSNYLHFIYNYYSQNKPLAEEAIQLFKALEIGPMWAVGGVNFKKLASLIGFKTALKIKTINSK